MNRWVGKRKRARVGKVGRGFSSEKIKSRGLYIFAWSQRAGKPVGRSWILEMKLPQFHVYVDETLREHEKTRIYVWRLGTQMIQQYVVYRKNNLIYQDEMHQYRKKYIYEPKPAGFETVAKLEAEEEQERRHGPERPSKVRQEAHQSSEHSG